MSDTPKIDPDSEFSKVILPLQNRLLKEGSQDKKQHIECLEEVYNWWSGNKDKIYKGPGDSTEGNSRKTVRHYPLLWSYVEIMKAILIDEIKVWFTGKFRQNKEYLGDVGNAMFEAMRDPMHWDDRVAGAIEQMIMFQEGIIGPYVDQIELLPDKIPALRIFNPWQTYSTRGRRFKNAPERLVVTFLEKSELIPLYPHLAEEIENIAPWSKDQDDETMKSHGNDRISAYHDLPGAYGDHSRLSENALKIDELWWRDPTRKRISRSANLAGARSENEQLINYLGSPNGPVPDSTLWILDEDFHDDHIPIHEGWLSMQDGSEFSRINPELSKATIEEMKTHVEEHKIKAKIWKTEQQGYVFVYSRGWRYALIANESILLEDTESPWLDEFGIVGPPFASFDMCEDPLNVYGKPWAQRLIDPNAGYSAFMAYAEDTFISRGNKLVVDSAAVKGGVKGITNNPNEPIEVTAQGDVRTAVMNLPMASISGEVFQFMNEMKSILEQTAGVHDPMLGKPGSNVRSAAQLKGLISQNEFIINFYMKRILPAIKKLAIMTWQVGVGIGLDSDYLEPVLNGVMADFGVEELEELENAQFTMNVKVKSGGSTTMEERRNVIEIVAPKFQELYAGLPGANNIIAEEMAKVYEEDFPGLKIMQQKLAQLQDQMMAAGAPPGEPGADTADTGAPQIPAPA